MTTTTTMTNARRIKRRRDPAPRVLLLDELTTFLDEADQAGVVAAVRKVVDSDDQAGTHGP